MSTKYSRWRTVTKLAIFVAVIVQVTRAKSTYCDFKSIFHTPDSKYDEYEILERSNFCSEDPKDSKTSDQTRPQAVANAQVMLHFNGRKSEPQHGPPVHIYTPYPPQVYPMMHKHRPHHVPYYQPYGMEYYPMPRPYRRHRKRPARPTPYSVYYPSSSEEDAYFDYEEPKRKGNHMTLSDQYQPHSCGDGEESSEERSQETAEDLEDVMKLIKRLERKLAMKKKVDDGMCPAPSPKPRKAKKPTTPKPCKPPATTTVKEETQTTEETMPYVGCEETIATSPQTIDITTKAPPVYEEKPTTPVPPCKSATTTVPPNCVTEDLETLLINALIHEEKERSKVATCPPSTTSPGEKTSATPEVTHFRETTVPTTCGPTTIITTEEIPEVCTTTAVPTYEPETTPPVPPSTTGQTDLPSSSPCVTTVPTYEPETTPTVPPSTTEESSPSTPCETTGPTLEPTTPTSPTSSTPVETTVPTYETPSVSPSTSPSTTATCETETPSVPPITTEETITSSTSGVTTVPPSTTEVTRPSLTPTTCETVTTPSVSPPTTEETFLPSTTPCMTTVPPSTTEVTSPPPTETTVTTYETVTTTAVPPSTTEETGPPSSTPDTTTVPTSTTEGTTPPSTPALTTVTTPSNPPPTTEESSSPSTVPPYETTISTYESTTSQIPLSTTQITTAETTVQTEITSSIPLSTTEEISTMVSTYEPETTPATMEETSLPSSTPCETTGPTYEPVRTPPAGSSSSTPVQFTVSTYDTKTAPSTTEETNSSSTPVEITTTPVPTPTSEETSSPASTPGETTATTYETEATTSVTPSTTEGTSLPSSTPAQTTVTTYETETTPSVPPSTTEGTTVPSTGPTYEPKTTPSDLPTTSPTNTPITTPTYPPTPDDTTYSTSVRSNIDEDQDYVPPDGSWYDYYEIHGSIDKETTAGHGDSVTTERTSESKPYEDFEVPEEVYPIPMTTENDLLYRKTHEYDMKTVEVTEGYGDSVITEGLPGYGKNAKDDSYTEETETPVEEKVRPGPGEFNSNFQWSTPMLPEESEVVRNKKGSSVGYEDSLTEESATTAGGYEPTEESYTYNFEENEEPHSNFHKTTSYDSFKGYPDEETVMYPTTQTSGKLKKGYNKSGEESEEIGYITTDELMHPEARKAKKKPTKEWFHTYSKEKETFVPIKDTQYTTDEKNEEPGYITTEELMHSKDGGITEYTENVPFFHGGHSARKKPKGGTITATEATPHVIKKKPSAIYDEDASVEDTIEDSLMSASTHSMTYLKKPDGYHEERSERSVSTPCDEEENVKIEESTEEYKPVIEENGGPPIYVSNGKGIHSTGELKKPHGLKVLDKASKGSKATHSDSETSKNSNGKAKRKERPEFKESGDMVSSKEVMKSSSIEDSSKESGKFFNSGKVNWSSSRKSPAEFDETSKELKKPKGKPTKSKDSSKGSGNIFETEKLKKPVKKPTAIGQSSEAVPTDVRDSGLMIKGDTATYEPKKPKSDDFGATKEAFGDKKLKGQIPKVQIGKDAPKKHSSIQKSSNIKSQDEFEESDDSPDSVFLNSEEEFEVPRKEDVKKTKNQGSKVKTEDKKGYINRNRKGQDEIEESGDSSVYVPTDDLFYSEEDLVYPTREYIKKLKDQGSENQSTPIKRAGKRKEAKNRTLKDFVIPEDLPRYGKNAKDDFLHWDEEPTHPRREYSKTPKDLSPNDPSTPKKRTRKQKKAKNRSLEDSATTEGLSGYGKKALDDSYAGETESPIIPKYKPTVYVPKDEFLHLDEEPAHPRSQDSKTIKDLSPKDKSTPNKRARKNKKAKNWSSEDSATTEGLPGYSKKALDDSYAEKTEGPIVADYKPTVYVLKDEFLHLDEEPAHPRRQDSKTPKDLSPKDQITPKKGTGKKKKAKNWSSEDSATTEGLSGYGKKASDDSYAGETESHIVPEYEPTVYVPKDEFLHLDEEPAHPRSQDSKTIKDLSPKDQSTPNKRARKNKKAKNWSSEDSATTEGLPGYSKKALDDSYAEKTEGPIVADYKPTVYVLKDEFLHLDEEPAHPRRQDSKTPKDLSPKDQITPKKGTGKKKKAKNWSSEDSATTEGLSGYGKKALDDSYAGETESPIVPEYKPLVYVPKDEFLHLDEEPTHPRRQNSKTPKNLRPKDQSTPNKSPGKKKKAKNRSSEDSATTEGLPGYGKKALDDSYAGETESPIVPEYKPTVYVPKDEFLHLDEEPAHPRSQDSKTIKDLSPKDQSTPNKRARKNKKAKNWSSEDSATTEGLSGYGKKASDDSYAGETESHIVPEYEPTVYVPKDEFLHLDEEPAHPRREYSKTPKDLSPKDQRTPYKGAGKKKKAKNWSSEDSATTEGLSGYGKKALDDSYAEETENPIVPEYKPTVYVPKDEFLHLDEELAHPRRQDSKTLKNLSPKDQSAPSKGVGKKKKAKNWSSEDSATTEGLSGYGKKALDDSYAEETENPIVPEYKPTVFVPKDEFLYLDEEPAHPRRQDSKTLKNLSPKDQSAPNKGVGKKKKAKNWSSEDSATTEGLSGYGKKALDDSYAEETENPIVPEYKPTVYVPKDEFLYLDEEPAHPRRQDSKTLKNLSPKDQSAPNKGVGKKKKAKNWSSEDSATTEGLSGYDKKALDDSYAGETESHIVPEYEPTVYVPKDEFLHLDEEPAHPISQDSKIPKDLSPSDQITPNKRPGNKKKARNRSLEDSATAESLPSYGKNALDDSYTGETESLILADHKSSVYVPKYGFLHLDEEPADPTSQNSKTPQDLSSNGQSTSKKRSGKQKKVKNRSSEDSVTNEGLPGYGKKALDDSYTEETESPMVADDKAKTEIEENTTTYSTEEKKQPWSSDEIDQVYVTSGETKYTQKKPKHLSPGKKRKKLSNSNSQYESEFPVYTSTHSDEEFRRPNVEDLIEESSKESSIDTDTAVKKATSGNPEEGGVEKKEAKKDKFDASSVPIFAPANTEEENESPNIDDIGNEEIREGPSSSDENFETPDIGIKYTFEESSNGPISKIENPKGGSKKKKHQRRKTEDEFASIYISSSSEEQLKKALIGDWKFKDTVEESGDMDKWGPVDSLGQKKKSNNKTPKEESDKVLVPGKKVKKLEVEESSEGTIYVLTSEDTPVYDHVKKLTKVKTDDSKRAKKPKNRRSNGKNEESPIDAASEESTTYVLTSEDTPITMDVKKPKIKTEDGPSSQDSGERKKVKSWGSSKDLGKETKKPEDFKAEDTVEDSTTYVVAREAKEVKKPKFKDSKAEDTGEESTTYVVTSEVVPISAKDVKKPKFEDSKVDEESTKHAKKPKGRFPKVKVEDGSEESVTYVVTSEVSPAKKPKIGSLKVKVEDGTPSYEKIKHPGEKMKKPKLEDSKESTIYVVTSEVTPIAKHVRRPKGWSPEMKNPKFEDPKESTVCVVTSEVAPVNKHQRRPKGWSSKVNVKDDSEESVTYVVTSEVAPIKKPVGGTPKRKIVEAPLSNKDESAKGSKSQDDPEESSVYVLTEEMKKHSKASTYTPSDEDSYTVKKPKGKKPIVKIEESAQKNSQDEFEENRKNPNYAANKEKDNITGNEDDEEKSTYPANTGKSEDTITYIKTEEEKKPTIVAERKSKGTKETGTIENTKENPNKGIKKKKKIYVVYSSHDGNGSGDLYEVKKGNEEERGKTDDPSTVSAKKRGFEEGSDKYTEVDRVVVKPATAVHNLKQKSEDNKNPKSDKLTISPDEPKKDLEEDSDKYTEVDRFVVSVPGVEDSETIEKNSMKKPESDKLKIGPYESKIVASEESYKEPPRHNPKKKPAAGGPVHHDLQQKSEDYKSPESYKWKIGPEEGYNSRSEECLEDTTSEDEDVIDSSVLSGKSIEDYLKKKIFGEENESGKKKVLGKDVIADEEKRTIKDMDKKCCLNEKEIVASKESYEEPTRRHDVQNMKESKAPICEEKDQAQVDSEGMKVLKGTEKIKGQVKGGEMKVAEETGKKKGPKRIVSHDVHSEKDAIKEIFNDGDGEKKKEGVGLNGKKKKGAEGIEDKVELYGNKSEELEKSGENEKGTEQSEDGTGSSDIYTEKEAIKENYGGKRIDEDVFHANKDREFKESDGSHNYGKKKKGIGVSEDKVEPHGDGNSHGQKKKPGIEDEALSENKGREFEESDSGEDSYEKKKKGIGVSEDEGKSSKNNKKQNRKLSEKAIKGPKGRGEQREKVIEDQVFLYVTTEKTSPSYVKVKPTKECDDPIPLALVEHGSLPKQGHNARSEESLEDTTGEDGEVLIDASVLSGKSIGDYLKKKIFDEEKEPGKKKALGEGKSKIEDNNEKCYLTEKDLSEEVRIPLEETYAAGEASEERAAAPGIVEEEDIKYREEVPVIEGGVQLKSEEINGFKEDGETDQSTCTVTEEINVSSSDQGYENKSSREDQVNGGDVQVKSEEITRVGDKGLGDKETQEFTCTTTEEAYISTSQPAYKKNKVMEVHVKDELELGEAEDQIEDEILKKDLNHVVVKDKVEYRPTTLGCDDADATATPVVEFKELKEYEVPVTTKEPDPCECLTEVTTIHAGSDDDKPKKFEVVPSQKSNVDALKTLYRALKHIKEAAEQHLSKVKIDPKKLGDEVVKKGEFVSPYDLYNSADEKSSKVRYEEESTLSGEEERVDGSEEGYQPIGKDGLDGEETDNGGEEIRVQVMEAVRPYNIEKQKKKGRGQETEKSNEERGFVTECLPGPSNGQYPGPLKKKTFGDRQEVDPSEERRLVKDQQGKKGANPNEERGFATECSAPNNADYVSYRPMKKKGFEERFDESEGNYQPTEKKEDEEMKTEDCWPNKKKVAEERGEEMGGERRGPQEKYYPVTPGNAGSIGYRPIKKKGAEEKSGEETPQRKHWVAEKGPEESDEEKPKQKPSEDIEYWPEKKKGSEKSGEERKPVKPSNVDGQKSRQPKRIRGEERVYPSEERVYPSGERIYPSEENVYPSEERKHTIETTGSNEYIEYWTEKKKGVEERVVSSEETGFLEKPPRKYFPITPDNVGDIVYLPHKPKGPSSNVQNPANWSKKKKGNVESQRKDPVDHSQNSEYRPAKKKGPSNVENLENWSKKKKGTDEEPQRKNPVSQDLPAKKKEQESTKRPFTDYEVVKTVPTYKESNPKPYKVYQTYEDGPYYKEDLTEESPEESIEAPTTPKPLYKLVYKPVSKKRPSQSKYQRVMPHIYAKTTPAPPSEELIPGSSEEEEAKDLPAKLIRKVGKILAGHGNGFDVFLSDKMLKRPVQRRPKVYLYKGSKGSEPCTDRYQVYPPPYFLPYPPPLPQYAPVDPYGMVHPNGRRCPYCAPYRGAPSTF